jgi:hypothetical protein
MAFVKATKEQAKLRLAVFGPSGSGKTYTSLRIATGIGGPIAVVDSERRTARKYSDRFDFAVEELFDKSIESYCKVIREAGEAKFNVLIIDSLSHPWQDLLSEIEKIAATRFRGNTWSAWSEGTPKQRMLVDTLLDCPCHIIATMRSKTEWAQETGNNGKVKPVKIGLAPEQGKGIEYEFDMLMELNDQHIATVSKDRTGKYQDKIIEKPGEDLGKELAAWLSEGAPGAAPNRQDQPAHLASAGTAGGDAIANDKVFKPQLAKAFKSRGFTTDQMKIAMATILKAYCVNSVEELKSDQRHSLLRGVANGDADKFKSSNQEKAA